MKQEHFQALENHLVLAAAESCGFLATGRILQLNSMENRVFAVEIEKPSTDGQNGTPLFMSGKSKTQQIIVKFYRPGRWSPRVLLSEHELGMLLSEENIPTPKYFDILDKSLGIREETQTEGSQISDNVLRQQNLKQASKQVRKTSKICTLGKIENFFYTVNEKVPGKPAVELTPTDLTSIGKMVARMHNSFENHVTAENFERHTLSTTYFGWKPLQHLVANPCIPAWLARSLFPQIETILKGLHWLDTCCPFAPVHGDLHRLNLLQTQQGGSFWLLDFDDCMFAPEIQDLWLLASGVVIQEELAGDEEAKPNAALDLLVRGYEEFRLFPKDMLSLVEPLRTLRMIHYPGWIAHRWEDPLFPQTFSFFKEEKYWEKLLWDLENQQQILENLGLLDF